MCVCVFCYIVAEFLGKRSVTSWEFCTFYRRLINIFDVNCRERVSCFLSRCLRRARKITCVFFILSHTHSSLDFETFCFRASPHSIHIFSAYIFVASITFVFFVIAYVNVVDFRDLRLRRKEFRSGAPTAAPTNFSRDHFLARILARLAAQLQSPTTCN